MCMQHQTMVRKLPPDSETIADVARKQNMIYYTLHPESWFLNRGFSIVVLNQNMFGQHVHKLCTLALMFTTFLGSKG